MNKHPSPFLCICLLLSLHPHPLYIYHPRAQIPLIPIPSTINYLIILQLSFADRFSRSCPWTFSTNVGINIYRDWARWCTFTGNLSTTWTHSGQANPGKSMRAWRFNSISNPAWFPDHVWRYSGRRIMNAIGRSPHLGWSLATTDTSRTCGWLASSVYRELEWRYLQKVCLT